MKTLIFMMLLLAPAAAAQQVKPPQPDYSRYGSYSRQLTVYRNTQAKLDADARRRYRKFREEVRRQVRREEPRTRVVVRRDHLSRSDSLYLHELRRRMNRR